MGNQQNQKQMEEEALHLIELTNQFGKKYNLGHVAISSLENGDIFIGFSKETGSMDIDVYKSVNGRAYSFSKNGEPRIIKEGGN